MHQSTTLSSLQTIWPRWASRQFLSHPIVQTLVPVTFGYSLSSHAVVMRQLRRWRRSLTRSHKRTSIGPSRSCWNGTTSAMQPEEITSKGTIVSCVWRCPWCNCYRRNKWTRRHEFKSWTRLIAFHIALIPLGKVWIQLFSLPLWVNSRTD